MLTWKNFRSETKNNDDNDWNKKETRKKDYYFGECVENGNEINTEVNDTDDRFVYEFPGFPILPHFFSVKFFNCRFFRMMII